MRIATLGPEGSFSEEAALLYGESLGVGTEIVHHDEPEDILDLGGGADLGLVAVENSLEGSIGHTLDLLRELDKPICGEVVLRIRHFLLASVPMEEVKRVFSHPAAIAQCRRFIRRELRDAEVVAASSTAQGALRASRTKGSAAIGSMRAGRVYGLEAIAEDIQDQESFTRFIVVGPEAPPPSGRDKTSLIFAVKDLPGALHKALGPFALRGINLTKIESRPSRRALGEYVFFADFEGHKEESEVKAVLSELEQVCASIKVLGSYPAASAPGPP